MPPYEFLASIYDKDWGKFVYHYQSVVEEIEESWGIKGKVILDVACGTGSLVMLLHELGASVFGVDRSHAMLRVAQKKYALREIVFVRGDMRESQFKSDTFDFIFCTFDAINYLLEGAEIEAALQNIRSYLKTEGIFIFDINTIHAYGFRHIGTFNRELEGISFIQKHEFFEEKCIEKTTFNFPNGVEVHRQRGYEKSEIDYLIQEAGFKVIKCLNAHRKSAGDETAERLVYFVRK